MKTLIRAAELLEADAECLYESHTLKGEWEPSAEGKKAKKCHAELIDVASELRVMAAEIEDIDDALKRILNSTRTKRAQQ